MKKRDEPLGRNTNKQPESVLYSSTTSTAPPKRRIAALNVKAGENTGSRQGADCTGRSKKNHNNNKICAFFID